jgi:hypothetical protein
MHSRLIQGAHLSVGRCAYVDLSGIIRAHQLTVNALNSNPSPPLTRSPTARLAGSCNSSESMKALPAIAGRDGIKKWNN